MIEVIVLSLLCLALASLVLRVALFFLDKDKGRFARIASIAQSIGMVPVTAFAWGSNIAVFVLVLFMLADWVAPERVMHLLGAS